MNEPEKITGDWIKQQCDFVYQQYKDEIDNSVSTFVLNPKLLNFRTKISHYQDICPHSYNENGYCIYCKKKQSEAMRNGQ